MFNVLSSSVETVIKSKFGKTGSFLLQKGTYMIKNTEKVHNKVAF